MVLVILFLPWLVMLLSKKLPFLGKLGNVFWCYLLGLLLSFGFKALGAELTLASDLASVLVCVAMPLILFSANLPALKKLARPMLASFGLNVVSVLLVAVGAYFLFRNLVGDAADISGMLVGTYTGGTPNMFAIGNGLGAAPERILLLQTSDMIGGGIYFFLLLSVFPPLFGKILKKYRAQGLSSDLEQAAGTYAQPVQGKSFFAFLRRLPLVGLAVVCVAVAAGICLLIPSSRGLAGFAKLGEHTAWMMLIVTTLGIALSFVKKVRTAPGSYESGQYFILMFSVAMGLCFDVTAISGVLLLLGLLLCIQFGTVALHLLLARLCGIDRDTMMITSTAGIFGPAFIMPVARALKNDEIVLPGILCGILGYAVGNYLGIGLGELLRILS